MPVPGQRRAGFVAGRRDMAAALLTEVLNIPQPAETHRPAAC